MLSFRRRWQLFTALKYLTYTLLFMNVFLFLQEELGSLAHTFTGSMSFSQYVQVFAATIDTAAWFLLLILFELETSVLDDARIRGTVRLALHGVRGLCYVAILYAFSGYCAELLTLYTTTSMPSGWDACLTTADQWSLQVRLDEYVPLTPSNCHQLASGAIRLDGFQIVAPPEVLRAARLLAWTDVINAAAWILVVVVLEVEVRLQLRGRLTDAFMRGTIFIKYGLYATLFVAAAYWGYAGSFLDFWDAFLWLFAFIFIELNVFDWQRETQAGAPAQGGLPEAGA